MQNHSESESIAKLVRLHVTLYLLRHKYKRCQEGALNLLSDFLMKFIEKIGEKAKSLTYMS